MSTDTVNAQDGRDAIREIARLIVEAALDELLARAQERPPADSAAGGPRI